MLEPDDSQSPSPVCLFGGNFVLCVRFESWKFLLLYCIVNIKYSTRFQPAGPKLTHARHQHERFLLFLNRNLHLFS